MHPGRVLYVGARRRGLFHAVPVCGERGQSLCQGSELGNHLRPPSPPCASALPHGGLAPTCSVPTVPPPAGVLLNVILPAWLIAIILVALMCLLITQSVTKVGGCLHACSWQVLGDRT